MTCKAIQYSDEMYCADCGLRWDVNDPDPPACNREEAGLSDRQRLEQVAQGYHDLMAIMAKQRTTSADLIRLCVTRLQSPDSRKRKEAIRALEDLATMMERGR